MAFLAPQRPGGTKIDLLKNTWASAWILGARLLWMVRRWPFYTREKEKLGSQSTILLVQPMSGLPDPSCALDIGSVYPRILLTKKDLEPGHEKTLFPHARPSRRCYSRVS